MNAPSELFLDVSAVASGKDADAYAYLADALSRCIPFDDATLFCFDAESGKMTPAWQYSEVQVTLGGEAGFLGSQSLLTPRKKPLIIPSISGERGQRPGRFNAFMSLPLWHAGQCLAMFNVGHITAHTYEAAQEDNYARIARRAARFLAEWQHRGSRGDTVMADLPAAAVESEPATPDVLNEALLAVIRDQIHGPAATIAHLGKILPLMVETRNVKKARNCALKMVRAALDIEAAARSLLARDDDHTPPQNEK